VDHAKGLTAITPLLPIDNPQTTPPVGPFNTISDLVFSPSGSYLFLSSKGPSPTANGTFYIWPVSSNGAVTHTPVINILPETFSFFVFSVSFLSDSKVYVTDGAQGGALLAVSDSYELSTITKNVVKDQVTICWSQYAPRFNSIFLADIGVSNLTIISSLTGLATGVIEQDQAAIGSFGLAIDGTNLYTLKGDTTITITDLTGFNNPRNAGKDWAFSNQFQSFDFKDIIPESERPVVAAGITIYPFYQPADTSASC